MSVNIDHTNDTVTTSSNVLTLPGVTVPANSPGNVARWVMDTGNSGASSSGYWTKIYTAYNTNNDASISKKLVIQALTDTAAGSAVIDFGIRNAGGVISSSLSFIDVLSASDAFYYNGFMLVSSSTTMGTNVELWMQTTSSYQAYSIYEIANHVENNTWSEAWNNGSTWTATTPSGVVTVTSDWAGSGRLTSTSFLNGWAGTAYYEKSADGRSYLYINTSTIGTTTDNTKIFTIPAGYRPSNNLTVPMTGNDTTFGGAAGRAIIDSSGNVYIYGYTGTNTLTRFQFDYVARN